MNIKTLTLACSVAVLASMGNPAVAAPGDVWTFNTCAATGRLGPTQGDCDTAYSGTLLDGEVVVAGGIQAWVVPETATYRIEALGAEGGTQTFGTGFPGGAGALAGGEIELTAGETVFFLVGQRGEDTREARDNAAPGGGGGTFVYRAATDPSPLLAAGGGGSGSSCSVIIDGLAGPDGAPAVDKTNGGTGGNGATNNVGDSSYWAGGGAGWLSDGTGGNNPTDNDPTPGSSGAFGGLAPINGGTGGARYQDGNDEGGDGGFGGGGGGGSDNMGGGGGGGFSGGGGASFATCGNEAGGGGGSFASGANTTLTAGANAGDGQVTVTQLDSTAGPTMPVPTLPLYALALTVLGLAGVGARRLRAGLRR